MSENNNLAKNPVPPVPPKMPPKAPGFTTAEKPVLPKKTLPPKAPKPTENATVSKSVEPKAPVKPQPPVAPKAPIKPLPVVEKNSSEQLKTSVGEPKLEINQNFDAKVKVSNEDYLISTTKSEKNKPLAQEAMPQSNDEIPNYYLKKSKAKQKKYRIATIIVSLIIVGALVAVVLLIEPIKKLVEMTN